MTLLHLKVWRQYRWCIICTKHLRLKTKWNSVSRVSNNYHWLTKQQVLFILCSLRYSVVRLFFEVFYIFFLLKIEPIFFFDKRMREGCKPIKLNWIVSLFYAKYSDLIRDVHKRRHIILGSKMVKWICDDLKHRGASNYFHPQATLRLYLRLAGQI